MTKPFRAIVLIHGLRGSHDGLASLAKALKKAGYTVFSPDLPGSGAAPALDPSERTLDGYANWLNHYIESLKLPKKPYLVGHSMGSIIVSHFLEKHPSAVAPDVVLLSPIFRSPRAQHASNQLFSLCSSSLRLLPKNTRFRFLKSRFVSFCISHYLTIDKSKQAEIDALHYRFSGRFASASSLLADMRISMQNQVVLPSGKRYLLILGNKDRLTSVKIATSTTKNQKNLKLKVLNNTGHLLNYEQPKLAASLMTKFYQKSTKR